MIVSLLFFACLLLPSLPQGVTPQRTFAVVVGISDYKRGLPGKGDLQYSDDDARRFSDLLMSHAGGDVPQKNIRLLINREASRTSILQAMTIFQRATPDDRIIFFFSGHGDEGMFLPYDGEQGNELWHTDIKAAFRKSLAGTKLLMADACMSGSMTEKAYEHALHPRDTTAVRDSARAKPSNINVVVMLSSRPYQDSQEDNRLHQGAFTYYLIKGARGAADTDPHDGVVTIKELHYYISRSVQNATKNDQTPKVWGQFPENLAFTTVIP